MWPETATGRNLPDVTEGYGGSLSVLGVDGQSERVYRFVLRNPGSTYLSICDGVGMSRPDLLARLSPLLARRLIRVAEETVTPEPPDIALGRLMSGEMRRLARAEERLAVAQSDVGTYVSDHVLGQRASTEPVPLDRIPAGELGTVITALIANLTGEMLFLRPDQWILPTGAAADAAVIAALKAGGSSRCIYPARVVDERPESVLARAAAGEQVRVVATLANRMAVFGSEAAILPEEWDGESAGRLVIRQPGIVRACRMLFDEMWRHAVTVPVLGEPRIAAHSRRQLLELLARGAKDEQIARSMGISLRTVRRRIADLLAELGVDSRFQAGMEAVRRGWL